MPPDAQAYLAINAQPLEKVKLAVDLSDGRALLVVGLNAVLRAVHVALHLRIAQVALRIDASHQLFELEDRAPRRVRRSVGAELPDQNSR